MNCASDDDIVPVAVEKSPKRPFSRITKQKQTQATPSIASEPNMDKNGVKPAAFLQKEITASIDSDDSVNYPGSSLSSRRGRTTTRDRARTIGTRSRHSQQQHTKMQGKIHTLDSSSDSDHLRSSRIPHRKSNPEPRILKRSEEISPERRRSTSRIRSSNHSSNVQSEQFVNDTGDKTRLGTRNSAQRAFSAPRRRSARRASSSVDAKNSVFDKMREDRRRREGQDQKHAVPRLTRSAKQRTQEPIVVDDCQYDSEYETNALRFDENNGGNRLVPVANGEVRDSMGKDKLYAGANRHDAPRTEKESNESEIVSLVHKEAIEEVKELNRDAPYTGPTHLIFEYPPQQRGKIRVTAEERARLQQRRYLNDSLIDFFFKYQEIALSRRTGKLEFSAKFFSSFFFGRLRRTKPIDYEGVKSWTKNVDLFANKFVFVPICESYHWSLIIVANLDKLESWLDRNAKDMSVYDTPRIIYLDSLDPSRGVSFGNTIRRYLVEEWLCRKLKASHCEEQRHVTQQGFEESISILKAKVPIQTNEYDCGLYVLNSLLMFLKNESGFMDKLLGGESNLSDAYTHVDIQTLRHSLIFQMNQFEAHWSETRGSEIPVPRKNSFESERIVEPNNEASISPPERIVGVKEDRNSCHEDESNLENTQYQRGDDRFIRKNESSSFSCQNHDDSGISHERRRSSDGEAEAVCKERNNFRAAEERSTEDSDVVEKEEVNPDLSAVPQSDRESLRCQNGTTVGGRSDSELKAASAEAEQQFHSSNGRYEETEIQHSPEILETVHIVRPVLMNYAENNVTKICVNAVSTAERIQVQVHGNPTKAIQMEVEECDGSSSYEIGADCDDGFKFNKKRRKRPLSDRDIEEQTAVQSSEKSPDSSSKRRRWKEIGSEALGDSEPERQFEAGFGGHSHGSESCVVEEHGIDIFEHKPLAHDHRGRSPVDYGCSDKTPNVTGDTEELRTIDHMGEVESFKRTKHNH